jgi:transformation/transcription domain-associated protein
MAASLLPGQNEMALVPHVYRLMVDSFPLAAELTYYYLLLRALFCAIGGHKFDTMYTVVTPLLQELLETPNRLLASSPRNMQDLIAELCLAVPVCLAHLLPYLGYSMKPPVYALRTGPELVAQGRRTLELCVDNLMPEFLDPTLSPVLRDSMGALHDILRPLPHPHISAHTMIRILGKLGGRNRRLQHEPLQPAYRSGGDELKLLLSSDGRNGAIDISPVCRLAAKSIHHAHPAYRAYKALKAAITIIVHKVIHQLRPLSIRSEHPKTQGCDDGRHGDVFMNCDEGLFSTVHSPEHGDHAQEFLRNITEHSFTGEGNLFRTELSKRTNFTPIVGLHIKVLTNPLAVVEQKDLEESKEIVTSIIKDIIALYRDSSVADNVHRDLSSILHLMITRFTGKKLP